MAIRDANAYCAFCSSQRKIYRYRGVRFFHIAASLLTSFILTLIVFQELDPRGIFLFILLLAAAEIFLRVRWRIHIVCRQCGFDPVLYLKNPSQAADQVKSFIALRSSSAEFLLAPSLNLPTLTLKKEPSLTVEPKKGKLLSQRI